MVVPDTGFNVNRLIDPILYGDAVRATMYVSPSFTVKATRRLFKGKINKRDIRVEILVTYGAPNYLEREFIKKCKKAGETFPVKKVQLKFLKKKK